jgi:hypothetical protein
MAGEALRVSALAAGGFHRLGRHWPQAGVTVAADEFTDAERRKLIDDPNLRVTVLAAGTPEPPEAEQLIAAALTVIGRLPDDAFGQNGRPKIAAVRAELAPQLAEALTVEQLHAAHDRHVAAAQPPAADAT